MMRNRTRQQAHKWAATVALAGLCLTPAHRARAADPLAYTLIFTPTGNAALDGAIAASAQLQTLRQKAPAGPFAVIGRARADLPRIATALESFGYYNGHASITIDGAALDAADLAAKLDAKPAGQKAAIVVSAALGQRFVLRRVILSSTNTPVPLVATNALQLPTPRQANAGEILAAADRIRAALAEDGYAFAVVSAPIGDVLPALTAVDVTIAITPGPRVNIGAVTYAGLDRTNAAYIDRRMLLHQGDLFTPSAIEAARQDLSSVGVFSGVRVTAAQKPDAAGGVPLTFTFGERPLHAVTADLAFSTDLGGSVGGTWSHRNLFGNAEQLNATLALTGLGGSASSGIGYNGRLEMIKPDFYQRDQSLNLSVQALKQSLQAYDQTALLVGGIVTRKLTRRLSVSGGISGIEEQIKQQGVTRDYTLIGVPLTARWDSTDLANPLDDPTRGIRASISATPTQSLGGSSATFVVLQAAAATFVDAADFGWGTPGHSVLAVRGLVGSAQGATAFDLPPDQRFYGGGSATVRGYRYQSIGPQFSNNDPQGGAAIDAATIEFRQRVWRDIGAVVFVDAGQVNSANAPFGGTVATGAGIGARYYTPIGPVRLDIAVPLKRSAGGDSFELYMGLGQAF